MTITTALIITTTALALTLVLLSITTIMWFKAEKKLARFGQSKLYKRKHR